MKILRSWKQNMRINEPIKRKTKSIFKKDCYEIMNLQYEVAKLRAETLGKGIIPKKTKATSKD